VPAGKPLPPSPQFRFAKASVEVEFAGGHTIRFEQIREGWQFVEP
jgi:hypothetical protein